MSDRRVSYLLTLPLLTCVLTHVLPIKGFPPIFVGRVITNLRYFVVEDTKPTQCTELSDSTTWRFVRAVLANGGGWIFSVRQSQPMVHSGKLTKRWEIHHLKMYLLLRMVVFHCYVGLPEQSLFIKGSVLCIQTTEPQTTNLLLADNRGNNKNIHSLKLT